MKQQFPVRQGILQREAKGVSIMKNKRIVSLLMSAAMSASLLCACGGGATSTVAGESSTASGSGSGETITLKMWGGVPAENGRLRCFQ